MKKKIEQKMKRKNTKLITYLNCQMKMMILTKSSKMKYICIISLYVHSYDKCGLHVWFFFLHLYVNCPSPFVIYFALWLVNFCFLFLYNLLVDLIFFQLLSFIIGCLPIDFLQIFLDRTHFEMCNIRTLGFLYNYVNGLLFVCLYEWVNI